MLLIKEKDKCTGCYACANVCPNKCISMETDEEGFWYPRIDKILCTNCGLCEKKCPILNKVDISEQSFPIVYAAINKSAEIIQNSSSGGVFTLIARYVLQNKGVVFGAAFNEKMEVEHIVVENEKELYRLQGSKYVQSRIGETYKQAKAYLIQERIVLFTGTPCQISGLKLFLGEEYENLICQDIVCHGVPSPKVWSIYRKYREEQAGAAVRKIFFRYKIYGWKKYSLLFDFENSKEYVKMHRDDDYMKAFLLNFSLRPSCFSCHFKGVKRLADFTLADFWHVNTYAPDMYNENGVSLVFLHTEKAKKVFESISDELRIKRIEDEDVARKNHPMISSVSKPKGRTLFFEKLETMPFDALTKKYCTVSVYNRLISKVLRAVSKINIRKEVKGRDEKGSAVK